MEVVGARMEEVASVCDITGMYPNPFVTDHFLKRFVFEQNLEL